MELELAGEVGRGPSSFCFLPLSGCWCRMGGAWKRLKMLEDIGRITLEDQPEWLKVVTPVKRNWLLLIVFSVALLVWVAIVIGMLVFLF